MFLKPAPQDHTWHRLRQRFLGLCGDSKRSDSLALWDSLSEHYSEPHRHYHHLGHVAASLEELDRCPGYHRAIEVAIWFHDVIYDPQRGDNEAASIRWFLNFTRSVPWPDSELISKVCDLIEATDFRKAAPDDPEIHLMVDIDLAILSEAAESYGSYCRAIRQEYAHVSDEDFRKGRARVMSHFLEKPIYRTACFLPRERRARANISRELESLVAGSP